MEDLDQLEHNLEVAELQLKHIRDKYDYEIEYLYRNINISSRDIDSIIQTLRRNFDRESATIRDEINFINSKIRYLKSRKVIKKKLLLCLT